MINCPKMVVMNHPVNGLLKQYERERERERERKRERERERER